MAITAEEKLMYEVMKAIYVSGIPINFKGSMVLKAYLLEAGYSDEIRHTVDIDANWYTDMLPTPEQMVESIQGAILKSGINLKVSLYRMYGEGKSAGFKLFDMETDEPLFSMDIDVNRPAQRTRVYEVAGLKFCGITPSQMIADKLSVISTDSVFRRIKDIVDLYYLSKTCEFNYLSIMIALKNSNRVLGSFDSFLHRTADLQHAYEKFRFVGNEWKPSFDEVYSSVKEYIRDVLPREREQEIDR